MARKRSRIDGLRAPFVVTIAAATGACGGSVSDTGHEVSVNPPGVQPCPTVLPEEGDACSVPPGLRCTFGGGPCQKLDYGECVGGRWTLTPGVPTTSCNPPPSPETTCPETEPGRGTYCNYQGPTCDYGPLCFGSFVHSAACENNLWYVRDWSCNPPPPPVTTCPATEPTPGDYCNYQGPACHYGPPCDGLSFIPRSVSCINSQWVRGLASCIVIIGGDEPPDAGPRDSGLFPIGDD